MTMRISIEELRFSCIIGILDFERTTPQEVIIDLHFDYLYEDDFIDYAEVVAMLKKMMIQNKYKLIEDALLDIDATLKKKYNNISSIELKITKPSILPDCRVGVTHKS